MAQSGNEIRELIERLTGQLAPLSFLDTSRPTQLLADKGIGYSQFNELLLLLGFERVGTSFFQFLVDGRAEYVPGSALASVKHLEQGVIRFHKMAMLRFGNIKFAFKEMHRLDSQNMQAQLDLLSPLDDSVYTSRHDPVRPIEPISGDDTYCLGYMVAADLKQRLLKNPNDEEAIRIQTRMRSLIDQGIRNHESYLASDHMDVYVATSMREKHEYYLIHEITKKVFSETHLAHLKLRWFDPTQAYCSDRIDKGLSEALMLKRAKCTLYLAQESDTLGKDSELASTLAQGKPVIAFVPRIDGDNDRYLKWLLNAARRLYPERSLGELIMQQLRVFAPQLAWTDPNIRKWLDTGTEPTTEIEKRLLNEMRAHYDKRAEMLADTHPLGIQVNLDTGVANGVLVARTTAECAELIYRVLTGRLEFDLEERIISNQPYLLLRETVSKSVFRVVSGDRLLTNAFWNFYLE